MEEIIPASPKERVQAQKGLSKTAARAGAAISVWVLLRIAFEFATTPVVHYLQSRGASDNLLQIAALAMSAVGVYIIATPIALWILGVFRNGGIKAIFAKSRMPARELAAAIPMAYAAAISVNLVATIVMLVSSGSIDEVAAQNPFLNLPTGVLGIVLNYLWMVAVAPIFEEILFRGGILRAFLPYGSWFAVVVSGLLFGLAHVNIAQMLYATVLGMLLGIIYVRAHSVVPCIITHLCINFLGITVATFVGGQNPVILGLFGLLIAAAVITGLVLIIITLTSRRDRLRLGNNCPALTRRHKLSTLLHSPLFVLMFALSLALSIAVNIPSIAEAIFGIWS
ncbi:MAG: lysostaphin resistance A-like protein [Acetanaerobacterium sp.]